MPDDALIHPSTAASSEDTHLSHRFPVVGIGASAGGLEAFRAFFVKMPPNTGMAFVMVPHLESGDKSLMKEIMGRYTSMPVVQVEDRMKIEPDHVYIVPSNRNLAVEGGELVPCERTGTDGVNLPVDVFFRSLAVARKERAVGIVLSGTMQDGAAGIRVIKEHGGLVIAQAPETARQEGMPQSAIETGMVDFVLPVEEMPEFIVNFLSRPDVPFEKGTEDRDELKQVLAIIKDKSRNDFSCYKRNTLVRRTERRMGLRQIEHMADYVEVLKNDPGETDALLKDLLIGVTGFFREKSVWEKVGREILPPMIGGLPPGRPLRVWIPACSTGEEAYTLAILIHDAFEKTHKHFNAQIFGTDIDGEAIAVARTGVYPETIAASVPSEYLNKYFLRDGGAYRILRQVRESVVFAAQNLVGDAPFSNLHLISCRNLMIYLNPDMQKKVMALFHFSLFEKGCLILGNSETIGHQYDLFETVSKEFRIYRRIRPRDERTQIPILKCSGRVQGFTTETGVEPSRKNISTLMQDELLKRFAPASVLIDKNYEILNLYGPTSKYLDLPQGKPVMELTSMVKEGLLLKLRAAIHKAAKKNETVTVSEARVKRDHGFCPVCFTVSPVTERNMPETLFLVTFQDRPVPETETGTPAEPDFAGETLLRQLEAELSETREDLKNTIEELETSNEELKASNEEMMSMNEELKASNEELMSVNEELQSSNEELETSKEELQSMNEELNTVNAELQEKVQALVSASNDMANLMNSTEVATVFLDAGMAIRRFTPSAKNLFSLIPSDVGRPIGDLAMRFSDEDLKHHVPQVLETLVPSTKEVQTDEGRWYIRRILPFRTQDNRVDGIVLTFADVTELKENEIAVCRSEAQLREKTQLLDGVLQHTHMMVAYLDPRFDFIWVNPAYAKACRRDPVFFPGKNHFDLYPHEENQAIFQRVVDTGEPFFVAEKPCEFPEQPERGVTYWDWSLIPTKGSDGRVTGLVFTLADVTDRVMAEKSLRESEARFRQLFENMTSGVAVYEATENGEDFLFKDLNKATGKIEQIANRDELIGKSVRDVFPSVVAFGLFDAFQRVWRTGAAEEHPAAFYKDERIEGWRENRIYKLPSGEIVAIYEDVGARKQAEEAVKESQAKLHNLLQTIQAGVVVHDAETDRVIDFNPAALKILGLTREQMVGKSTVEPVWGLITENGAPMKVEDYPVNIVKRTRRPLLDYIVGIVKPDRAEPTLVMVKATPQLDGNGTLKEIIVSSMDITKLKQVEEELLQSQKLEAIGTLAGGIAHDFNNILSSVLGFAELALDEAEKGTAIEDSLMEIYASGKRARDLVEQILTFSRHDKSEIKAVQIAPLLTEALKMLRSTTPTSIEIRQGICSEPMVVEIDPSQLTQVVLNLATNAKQAVVDSCGVLEVRLDRVDFGADIKNKYPNMNPGKYARITFSDTGTGIPQEHLDKIFEPYFTTKEKGTGTGLGLSVVHGIVRKSNGHITVASEVGMGSTFHVYLPLASDAASEGAERSVESVPKGTERILLVDDELPIVKMQQQRLERLGYKVTSTSGSIEALEMFRASPDKFDLVITDMSMPGMTGKQLAAAVKAVRPDVPVILCTGFSEQIDGRGENLDVEGFLMKPVDRGQMAGAVRKVLDGAGVTPRQ